MANDGSVRTNRKLAKTEHQSRNSDYPLFYSILYRKLSAIFGFCVLYFNITTVRLDVCSHVRVESRFLFIFRSLHDE